VNLAFATFIRKQVAYYDIEYRKSSSKYLLYDLSEDMSTLEETYKKTWSSSFLPFVNDVIYNRGCVELIKCSAKQFRESQFLFEIAPIRHLDLIIDKPEEILLIDEKYLLNVQSLSINNCNIGDLGVTYLVELENLKNLRWLQLERSNINVAGVESLIKTRNIPKLEYVDLTFNPCDPIERFSSEYGAIMDSWLPKSGEKLEVKYGRVNWFYRYGEDIVRWYTNRFHLATSL
jgi:hypothetical protein